MHNIPSRIPSVTPHPTTIEPDTAPAAPTLRSASRSHPDLARTEALIHEHRIKAALARSESSGRTASLTHLAHSSRSSLSRNSSSTSLVSETEPMRWFSKGGDTALHIACHLNQRDRVAELLAGPDVDGINQPNALGQTPLHFAAKRKNLDIIKLLLAHGANPVAQDRGKSTPLWFSVINGHPDGVSALLLAIQDPVTRARHAAHCLEYAAANPWQDLCELLARATHCSAD